MSRSPWGKPKSERVERAPSSGVAFWEGIEGFLDDEVLGRQGGPGDDTGFRRLLATPPEELFAVGERLRHACRWRDSFLAPHDVGPLVDRASSPIGMAAVLSMHHSGYVRETAVVHLGTFTSGQELPWLLIRCADWVAEVQAQAERIVASRMDGDVSEAQRREMFRHIALITGDRLRRSALQERLIGLLRASDQRAALRDAATSDERSVRRAAIRLLVEEEPSVELLRQIVELGELASAVRLSEELLASPETSSPTANLLFDAHHPRLRELGLFHLLRDHPPALDQRRTALFDRSAAVRRMAQRSAKNDGVDLEDTYRGALQENPLGSLLGLDDLQADAVGLARPFVGSGRPRVRAAATRIIARSAARDHLDLLLELAAHDSKRVAWEAASGVRSLGVTPQLSDQVWAAASQGSLPSAGRRRLFRGVIAHGSRWTSLVVALRALDHEDPLVRKQGAGLLQSALDAWNRSFTRPAPGQLEEIEELLERVTAQDPEARRRLATVRELHAQSRR